MSSQALVRLQPKIAATCVEPSIASTGGVVFLSMREVLTRQFRSSL
jgi:hypothetical protein